MPSFDITSEINLQEVDNAINQASREIGTRYDFRGSKSSVKFDKEKNQILLVADDAFKMKAVVDIVQNKAIKRGISLKALKVGEEEEGLGGLMKCTISLVMGIDQEKGKLIVKAIKETKSKVQASIQEDTVRVSGKKKDELQEVMAFIKSQDYGIPLQFGNYRD